MSNKARRTLRSFLPERKLIENRDAEALWIKYCYGQPGDGLLRMRWAFRRQGRTSEHPDNIQAYEPFKRLGSLMVEVDRPVPAGGSLGGHRIRMWDNQHIQLHLQCEGAPRGRDDLQTVAEYLSYHPGLAAKPYVVGITYSELSSVLQALRFQEMPISELHPAYQHALRAEHRIFGAFNPGQASEFRSSLMFMPTNEFIERFSN